MKIAIIGGTGDMGYGLALRFGAAGHTVLIGSRQQERAAEAAQRAKEAVNGAFCGLCNPDAVKEADLCIIAVPSAGHRATVASLREELQGKAVLDITVPMAFGPLRYAPPAEGSNALEAVSILGPDARFVAGAHTISATLLQDISKPLDVDALLVGTDADLKAELQKLFAEIGIRAFDAGSLVFSPTVESLTPMLIGMNKRYGSKHIGFHLVGFPGED